MLADLLYRLSERDVQARLLDPALRQVQVTAALTTVNADGLVVPIDQVLLLSSMCVRSSPDPANSAFILSLTTLAPQISIVHLAQEVFPVLNNTGRVLNWSGHVIVPPGWTVRGTSTFTAAGAANTVIVNLHGVLIPRGNVERIV